MSEVIEAAKIQATGQIVAAIIETNGMPLNLDGLIKKVMEGFVVAAPTKEQIIAKVRSEFPYFREYANKIQAIKRLRELANEWGIEFPLKEAKEEVESWGDGTLPL